MAEFPILPWDVRAFLTDTQHLDARETGAYGCLLWHAWVAPDCGLPDDDKRLALLARCTAAEWRKIRSTVMGYFYLSRDGRWHQKRLDETKVEVAKKSAKASAAATARWLKWLETRRADADAYVGSTQPLAQRQAQCHQNLNTDHESSSSEISTDAARGASRDGSAHAPRARQESMQEVLAKLAARKRKEMLT